MFKIEPMQDKSKQNEICNLCGVEYKPDFFAYYMYELESGLPLGMSQFEIRDGYGYISDLVSAPDTEDLEAMFILGRQTMNFIDLCGAHKCIAAADGADERLLHAIGFRQNEEKVWSADMLGMFDGKCDGSSVKL